MGRRSWENKACSSIGALGYESLESKMDHFVINALFDKKPVELSQGGGGVFSAVEVYAEAREADQEGECCD